MTSFGDGFEKGDFYDKMRAILICPKYVSSHKRSARKVVDLFCRFGFEKNLFGNVLLYYFFFSFFFLSK